MPKKKKQNSLASLKQKDTKIKTSICRICLGSSKHNFVSLFDSFRDSTILTHVLMITELNLVPDDGLPSKICDQCLADLETAVDFKLRSQKSESYLQQSLEELSQLTEEGLKAEIKVEPLYEEEIGLSFFDADCDIICYSPTTEVSQTEPILDIPQIKQEIIASSSLDTVICDYCGGVFKSKCKLRVHIKREHKPILECPKCKRDFLTYHAYHRHMKNPPKSCIWAENANIVGKKKNKVISCKKCDYQCRSLAAFQTHFIIHTGLKPHVCNLCPAAYTQICALISHKEKKHDQIRVEMTCSYCGKHVRGREKVYQHLKSHSTQRYQCDICKLFLKSRGSLIVHLKLHSGVKSYTCEVCAASFFTVAQLSTHKRLKHCPPVYFNCDLCPFKSRKKEVLVRHKVKHDSEEYHFCPVCGKPFEVNFRLQVHMITHVKNQDGIKHCPFCPKAFLTLDSINRHIREKHQDIVMENKPHKITVQIPIGKETTSHCQPPTLALKDSPAFSVKA